MITLCPGYLLSLPLLILINALEHLQLRRDLANALLLCFHFLL